MVNTIELEVLMLRKKLSRVQVAKALGVHPNTLKDKLKSGNFYTSEAEILIKLLDIENPASIFFSNNVS